jgi:hemin uptake protein HemP
MPHSGETSPSQRPGLTPRNIESGELFDGATEVYILHNGEQYRLRITRQDKLILTK